ncbi:MAG: hypothetical protein H0W72_18190 [Planctomycetes bacterium]|nr:hypothetical protein [Planctomycetota bacterium]
MPLFPPADAHDGSAAQIVPRNVEKLPLYHWRPGARLLAVGARDGAAFAGDDAADATSYRRPLDEATLIAAQAKLRTDGVCAAWSESLRHPLGLAMLRRCRKGALVIATAGSIGAALVDELLAEADAWVLLVASEPGPLAKTIVARARHVEVQLAVDHGVAPTLDWERIAAAHLCLRRAAADPAVRAERYAAARATLPADLAIYDDFDSHSRCRGCEATLVWRAGGTARRDRLADDGRCADCGRHSGIMTA